MTAGSVFLLSNLHVGSTSVTSPTDSALERLGGRLQASNAAPGGPVERATRKRVERLAPALQNFAEMLVLLWLLPDRLKRPQASPVSGKKACLGATFSFHWVGGRV